MAVRSLTTGCVRQLGMRGLLSTGSVLTSALSSRRRIAAVNAECDVEDAPRRRRRQKSTESKAKAGAARVSAGGRSRKASGSAKKKAKKGLEHAIGKAAERDPHALHCHQCGATAVFGLRGGKEGGEVRYFCRGHVHKTGCFGIDGDRGDWAVDRGMRGLRAEERRLEEELRNLGGPLFAAEPAAEQPSGPPCASAPWNEFQSTGDWVSMLMSRSLIAMLLTIGGIESNPGPLSNEEEIEACRRSWEEANPRIGAMLLAYLAKEKVHFADWGGKSLERRLAAIDKYKKAYEEENVGAKWASGWDDFLENAGAAGGGGQSARTGPSIDVEMREANQDNQGRRKKYIGDLTEGINNRSTEAYSSRAKTVDKVIDAIDELGAVLVRAPPQSGKTSLLQLVEDKLASMQSKVYYVSLGLYDPTKEDSFERLWAAQHPGVDFNNLAASPKNSPDSQTKPAPPPANVYLLVDEAQAAFCNHDLELFKKMKEIRSGRSKSPLRILLVSCWGSKRIKATSAAGFAFCTPGSWNEKNTIGLWQKPTSSSGLDAALQFTVEEAEEYWLLWLAANGWSGYSADRERNYLFVITQRQPGALSHLLDCIKGLGLHRLQVSEAEWHEKVQAWLLSEKLIKLVADLRSMSI